METYIITYVLIFREIINSQTEHKNTHKMENTIVFQVPDVKELFCSTTFSVSEFYHYVTPGLVT